MKKSILLIALIIYCLSSCAQNFQWAKSLLNSSFLSATSSTDIYGNVYTTGQFRGAVDFDPGAGTYNLTAAANRKMFLLKLNNSGNFVWVKEFDGSGSFSFNKLIIDTFGNIYATGELYGTIDFDPDTGTSNLSSNGAQDICLVKFDASGKLKWARSFGLIGSDWANSGDIDKYGNFYAIGIFGGTLDFDPSPSDTFYLTSSGSYDIFILKLDSLGNFGWVKKMGGTNSDYGEDIDVDRDGNIFTTGTFQGTADFDPGAGYYNLIALGITSYDDIFISKLNSSGDFIWAKKIGGTYYEYCYHIAVSDSGNIYISGRFYNTLDFDPDSSIYNLTSAGGSDIFITKLDSSGKFKWAKRIGNANYNDFTSMAIDIDESVYITGTFDGTIDFNPGNGIFNITPVGTYDAFILKLTFKGDFAWALRLGDTDNDNGTSIAISFNDIIITGYFNGTVDFDPSSGTNFLTSIPNYRATFILKLCNPPPTSAYITGPVFFCEGSTKTFYIPPTTRATSYFWTVPSDAVINSGDGTTSINVTFGKSSGIVSVTPGNSCGTATPTVHNITLWSPPAINAIAFPSDTICAGNSVILKGSGGTSYSWSGGITDGVPFIPTTTTTYIVSGINSNGCSNSDTITIFVKSVPIINTQPIDQFVDVGKDAYFFCSSLNSGISYQWQENRGSGFFNLTNSGQFKGTASDTLFISKVLLSQNNYQYRCIINNGYCSDTSNVAKLNATCTLNFVTQPKSKSVVVGVDVLFNFIASSEQAIINWQLNSGSGFFNLTNSGNYNGVNNDSLLISNVSLLQNNYKYRCIISEGGCLDTSNIVTLNVNCNLSITQQPSNKTTIVNSDILFISSSSSPSAIFQWQEDAGLGYNDLTNNITFSGVNNDTLRISKVSLSLNNNKYRCFIAESGCSDTSTAGTLNIICDLAFSSQPISQSILRDSTAIFIATSTNTNAAYQWQQNAGTGFTNIINGGQYLGATNDTLKINGVSLSQNNFSYRCLINESGCFDTSNTAILSVSTTGISKSLPQYGISFYPNPASKSITLQSSSINSELKYFITNATGSMVLTGKITESKNEIDISQLASGFYLLQVQNADFL